MKEDKPTCGQCVNMRDVDGYCSRNGSYRNALAPALKCFVSRLDVEDTIAAAPKASRKPGAKVCKKCGRELPIEQFPLHPKSRDHHSGTCRECLGARMREIQKGLAKDRPVKPKKERVVEDLPEGMKRCKRCGEVLPVTEFGAHRNTYDHLHPLCNKCRAEVGRETYERNCAKKGVRPKPPKGQEDNFVTLAQISAVDLVEELRRRGYSVECTKTEVL